MSEISNKAKDKWYDNIVIVIVLLIIFFPVGLYGAWKSEKRSKKSKIIISCVFGFFLLVVISGNDDSSTENTNIKSTTNNNKMVSEKSKSQNQNLPSDQTSFISIIEKFSKEYKKAGNDMKKSAVRTKRGQAIGEWASGGPNFIGIVFCENWVGKISSIGTNNDGKGILEVELKGTNIIKLKTNNNAFSDTLSIPTLIEQSSPMFVKLSDMNKGDLIRFSATFLSSDKNDFISEMSMTEYGSMTDPEFIVQFSKINKL